ncbi:MAG: YncE family protein, partial [candidate division WOR-3 bacterium]
MLLACFLLAGGVNHGQYLEAVVPTGDTPIDVVWSPLVNKVFCANSQDASITVISGETNEVLSTIPVGDYPTFLCLNSDGSKVYCTRGEDNKLVVINAAAESVLKIVDVPYFPLSMVYNEQMSKLYISCNDDPVYRITVLDAVADTVLRHIPVRGVGRL